MNKIALLLTLLFVTHFSIASEVLILEEQTIKRSKGKPVVVDIPFSSKVNLGKIVIQSQNVSSAKIKLNDVIIVREKDFKNNNSVIEIPVNLESDNRLEITIKGKPGGEIRTEVFAYDDNINDATIVFNSNTADMLTFYEPSTGKLIINKRHSQINNANVGDIVAISVTPLTPSGFLGEIIDIQYEGDQIHLSTKPTSIFKAIKNVEFIEPISFDDSTPQIVKSKAIQGARSISSNNSDDDCYGTTSEGDTDGRVCFTLVDKSFNKKISANSAADVWLEGRATIGGYGDIVLKAGDGNLEVFSTDLVLVQNYSLNLVAKGGISIADEFNIFEKNSTVKIKFIGYFPVVYQYKINVLLTMRGSTQGVVTSGITLNKQISAGIHCSSSYVSDCSKYYTPKNATPTPNIDIQAELNAKAGIKGVLTLEFYGAAGPYIAVQPYINAQANLTRWSLFSGVEGYVGLSLNEILRSEIGDSFLSTPFQLFNESKLIAEGSWDSPDSQAFYEVYGGNNFIYGVDAYTPENHGYSRLSYSRAGGLNLVSGAYDFYIIVTRGDQQVEIDAVTSLTGTYSTTNTGNAIDYQNLGGQPDGKYVTIGNYDNGGFVVIDARENPTSAILIYAR